MGEAQEKILAFENQFHEFITQTVEGIECVSMPFPVIKPTENLVTLKLTQGELLQLLSSIQVGAEWTYPDKSQQILFNFMKGLICPPIMEDQECLDYPTYASFITYAPENPYIQPDLIPEGYLIPPFFVNGQNGHDEEGYEPLDIITPFGAFELLGGWFDIIDGFLPQITVMVNGAGKAFVKLLPIFNGGMACITLDAPPNLADIFLGIVTGGDNILDLNLDIVSVPPETAKEIIYELDISGTGLHTIYITFLPVVDDASVPLRYGGGFRGVQLCNFVEQPAMGIQNIRFDGASCQLQVLEDGDWVQVTGWEDWLDCVPSGGGSGGAAALKTEVQAINIATAKTTTSTGFVAVGGSTFPYDFTRNNALIVCHDINMSNSLTNGFTYAQVTYAGEQGLDNAPAENFGQTARPLAAAARFTGLLETSGDIGLDFRVSSGTGTIAATTGLVFTIIEYDNLEDLFVEDIRIFEGELQKKIGGAWIPVSDSFEAIINSLEANINAAQTTANGAVSTNASQQSQINSIISVNNTQNGRLTVIEDDVEDLILSVSGINGTLATHTTQIAALQSITGILAYGGAWATTQNYDDSPYFWATIIGAGYVAGQGFRSDSNGLTISMNDARLAECQCTHVYARVAMINAPTGSLQWRVQGGAYGSLKYNGTGGSISDGWLRVPNWTGTNFQIELSGFGDFYLRSVYFLGRGAHNPFA